MPFNRVSKIFINSTCSTTFDEFARKWNKPVHNFLLRYLYLESIKSYKFSKSRATFVTFLFSSCLHEMIMAVASRQIRLYLFVLQMIQIPLIYIGRLKFFKDHYIFANMFVWASLAVG